MKKVLILAYDFPPYNSVGAQRPYSWYKYFKKHGLYPIVVARQWNDNIQGHADYVKASPKTKNIITTNEYGKEILIPYQPGKRDRLIIKHGMNKYKFLRRFYSFVYSYLRFTSLSFDNTANYFTTANKVIKEEKPVAILTTGEPFILFRYAAMLSKRHKIPWIPDYRDGWTTDRTRLKKGISNILRWYYRVLEKKYLKKALFCSFATTDLMENHANVFNTKGEVIYNGYNELPEVTETNPSNDFFKIGYSGKVLFFQPIEVFLDGFRKFIKQINNKKIKLTIYGGEFYKDAKQRVLSYAPDLKEHISFTPRMQQQELYNALYKEHIGLLLASKNRPAIPVKFFDYLLMQKPVIMVKDDKNEMSKIMTETNAGVVCNTSDDICTQLLKYYNCYKNGDELVSKPLHVEQYSREYQAGKLAKKVLEYLNSYAG